MIYKDPNGTEYQTDKLLGSGGEGKVYTVVNNNEVVLKCYNEPLPIEKQYKLLAMVANAKAVVTEYAAWPQAVVADSSGNIAGFVMRKLAGFAPLHQVFSPLDRKKLFPDKGYNFLIHVARNVATAFHRMHSEGIVIGDINEGNILINKQGIVCFIDCDSFQITAGNNKYLCEVGVPRYLPPEILRKSTFSGIVRSENTDNFSLGILIFQLLFLGRHPYAGVHKGSGDMDEETAIRLQHFAYSLTNERKKLLPPKDSIAIDTLPERIVWLFHRTFETDERATAAEWVSELSKMLEDIQQCSVSSIHNYPTSMVECPWCRYRKERGIMYFLDDSYLLANSSLGNIEHFVNGFKPQPLNISKWSFSGQVPDLKPTPVSSTLKRQYRIKISLSSCLLIGALTCFYASLAAGFTLLLLAIWVYVYSKWARALKKEKANRHDLYLSLINHRNKLLIEYEQTKELIQYKELEASFVVLIQHFKDLPNELKKRKEVIEQTLYEEQLNDYLKQFEIEHYSIPSIGSVKKTALRQMGIVTAADIRRLSNTKVQGIGPAMEGILKSWRLQMASGFVYIPDNYFINKEMEIVLQELNKLKIKLEDKIRADYQSMSFLRLNVLNKAKMIDNQLNELTIKIKLAELDVEAFKKYAS